LCGRTLSAADRDRSPLRQTAFCVAGPLGLGMGRTQQFRNTAVETTRRLGGKREIETLSPTSLLDAACREVYERHFCR